MPTHQIDIELRPKRPQTRLVHHHTSLEEPSLKAKHNHARVDKLPTLHARHNPHHRVIKRARNGHDSPPPQTAPKPSTGAKRNLDTPHASPLQTDHRPLAEVRGPRTAGCLG